MKRSEGILEKFRVPCLEKKKHSEIQILFVGLFTYQEWTTPDYEKLMSCKSRGYRRSRRLLRELVNGAEQDYTQDYFMTDDHLILELLRCS